MAFAQRPDWLIELIAIVQRLCPETGVSASAAAGRARKFGRVSRDAERGAGWFWTGLAGRSAESDQLEAGYLAPAEGSEQHRFQLIESVQEGNVLKVRVAEHAPAEGLFLWIPGRAPGLLEKSLLDALSRIDRFDLVNRFAEGRTDPVPLDPGTGLGTTGTLNAEQSRARAGCRSPGVHLVWGPPGTGKTKVIALALQDIIASGKSALLVSATNIAVDNALAKAAAAVEPGPGVMVRAGTPHLREVAGNPAVCLQKLVRHRQEALEQLRCQLEEQITACQGDPDMTRLAEVRAELEDFDLHAYLAAEGRLANAKLRAGQEAELSRLQQEVGEMAAAADTSGLGLDRIRTAHREAESARQHIAKAGELERKREALASDVQDARVEVLRREGRRDRLVAELDTARTQRRFGNKHQKTLIKENAGQLAAAISRRDELANLLAGMTGRLGPQIEGHLHDALPHTTETIAQLDEDLRTAQDNAERAVAAWEMNIRRTRELAAEVDDARRQPKPTAADHEFVSLALQRGLPQKLKDMPELEQRAEAVQRKILKLEEQYEQVIARMRREGLAVRREIVHGAHVVAATLALLRISPELHEREYDYVIVDEVAFACPPEVVYAASRASEGVTLLGDFLQNGPIVPKAFEQSAPVEQAIQRWYYQDCFAIFGIRDALSAQADSGCVTLGQQYRFGPVITELANAVAYRGVLQLADHGRDDVYRQEIVLIDVDGLGDELASVRRGPAGGSWWPVGALISRAIADREVRRAEEAGEPAGAKAGIVVPYRLQQELIQDVLNESGASPQVDVGTSHRFQGREFDTVIFDLVEDGSGPERDWGWVAKGNLDGSPWEAKGLRLFNVGITRARRRLYLIANAAAIHKASKGPLRAVRQMLEADKIHVVRAADILGVPDAPAGDPLASEVWHALRSHATLIELYDEDHLPDELCRRIDEARERIWLWSPWVGRRSEQLLPHLRDAQDRGVRVHAVVLPGNEVTRQLQPRHQELAAQIAGTVYLGKEHQKIIVIDRSLTFIGSMNVLAHVPGGRHETMALFQSATLADRILEHERVDELADPPRCPRCNEDVRYVRAPGGSNLGKLRWTCTTNRDGDMCGWTKPFADRPKTRNQPRQSTARPGRR